MDSGTAASHDAIDLLEAMEGAKAMYRKLFDGRGAAPSMSADELLSLCAGIRSYHEQGMMGALALVAKGRADHGFRPPAWRARVRWPIKVFPAAGAKLDRRSGYGT